MKRFVIVGSGWRSLYYVRVAKALPNHFELCAMLCRTPEKAEKLAAEHKIHTTTDIEECKNYNPDFVVVAVNKSSIASVTKEWLGYGFHVLCETPAAMTLNELSELWELHKKGAKLTVAEQYTRYPSISSILKVVNDGFIGEPQFLNISLANDHHGANLIRAFLGERADSQLSVSAKTFEFETYETFSRYEKFFDGRTGNKKRTVATFEFDDKKVALYDFDSDQYRSPIRNSFIKIQGTKGEIFGDKIEFIDSGNNLQKGRFDITYRSVTTSDPNPNLHDFLEVEKICLITNSEERILYEAPFGLCSLSEDETAIAILMTEIGEQSEKQQTVQLQNCLSDAYTAILMQNSVNLDKKITGVKQIWQ